MGHTLTEGKTRVSAQRQSIAKQIDPGPHAVRRLLPRSIRSALQSPIAEVGRSAPKLAVRSYSKKLTKIKTKLTSPPKKLLGEPHPHCINDFKLAFKSFRQSEGRATKSEAGGTAKASPLKVQLVGGNKIPKRIFSRPT